MFVELTNIDAKTLDTDKLSLEEVSNEIEEGYAKR